MVQPGDLAAGAIAATIFFVLMPRFTPRAWVAAPRDRFKLGRAVRRMPWWQKLALPLALFGIGMTLVTSLVRGRPEWLVYLAVCAAPAAWLLLFGDATFHGTDAALNYRFDPARCGSCGYELHVDADGHKPGRCPECDWPVPAEIPRIEPPDWWVKPRHGRRVEYLYDPAFTARHWRRQAALGFGVAAGVLPLAFLPGQTGPFACGSMIGAAGGVRALLNARRAAAYGRRLAAAGGGGFNAARE